MNWSTTTNEANTGGGFVCHTHTANVYKLYYGDTTSGVLMHDSLDDTVLALIGSTHGIKTMITRPRCKCSCIM